MFAESKMGKPQGRKRMPNRGDTQLRRKYQLKNRTKVSFTINSQYLSILKII